MPNAVAQRRETRIAEIITCAWRLAAEHGIAGVSLHALASEVGMRQPSLYGYFDSKFALYDAMFAEGNQALLDHLATVEPSEDPTDGLRSLMRAWAAFCMADPPRYELLFQRHLPGFEPSPEAYAIAQRALDVAVQAMRRAGVIESADVDCLVAVVAGLMDAQISNDPGGDRWIRHLDRMIDLVLSDVTARSHS